MTSSLYIIIGKCNPVDGVFTHVRTLFTKLYSRPYSFSLSPL
jgi:hypothetical protein